MKHLFTFLLTILVFTSAWAEEPASVKFVYANAQRPDAITQVIDENGIVISNVIGLYDEGFIYSIDDQPLYLSMADGSTMTKVVITCPYADAASWIADQTDGGYWTRSGNIVEWAGEAATLPIGNGSGYVFTSIEVEGINNGTPISATFVYADFISKNKGKITDSGVVIDNVIGIDSDDLIYSFGKGPDALYLSMADGSTMTKVVITCPYADAASWIADQTDGGYWTRSGNIVEWAGEATTLPIGCGYGYSITTIDIEYIPAGTPTAVESIDVEKGGKALKTLENGKVVIIRGDKKYDITGRKL
ncbi:MAG: hypothetical protein MJZ13_06910 [Bacteroidales bacterium]|nr:hypothetical protein [Bacteroidales bacterium]